MQLAGTMLRVLACDSITEHGLGSFVPLKPRR